MLSQLTRRIERLEQSQAVKGRTPKIGGHSYMRDPVDFSRAAFGHDPWGVQADILRSVAQTAVRP
jgi:hypothetical protein